MIQFKVTKKRIFQTVLVLLFFLIVGFVTATSNKVNAQSCKVCTITSCKQVGERCISGSTCSTIADGDTYNDTSENCVYRPSGVGGTGSEYFCSEWGTKITYETVTGRETCRTKYKTKYVWKCKWTPPKWKNGRYVAGSYDCGYVGVLTSSVVCSSPTYQITVYTQYCKRYTKSVDSVDSVDKTGFCEVAVWRGGSAICGSGSTGYSAPSCSCSTETSCTAPACASGEIDFDTGDGAGTDTTCSYTTGSCVGETSECATTPDTKQCWIENNTQPSGTPTLGLSNSTTDLGCTSLTSTGQEVNNPLPVTLTYTDVDNIDEIRTLAVWFDKNGAPPSVDTITSPTSQDTQNNGGFGLLFRKTDSGWQYLYASDYNGGSWRWVRASDTLNGQINGKSGLPMVEVTDAVIVESASDITLNLNLEFLNEQSGLASYEKVDAGTYNVYSAGTDWLGFLPYEDENIRFGDLWTDSGIDWVLDLTAPVTEDFAYNIETAESISLDWDFSDTSSIQRVVGDANIASGGLTNGPIDDLTSGVLNYELGSAVLDDTFYNATHLWSLNGITSRSETINLKSNEGGSLEFTSHAFDSACNVTESNVILSLDTAWVTTKAGIFFSQGGTNLKVSEYVSGVQEPLSDDEYWKDQYNFYKDEVDISTEFVSGGTDTLNELIYDIKLGSVRASNYYDRNNKQQYWYDFFKDRFASKLLEAQVGDFTEVTMQGDTTLLQGSLATDLACDTSSLCVVHVSGNLTIEDGFTCDAQVAFLVDGNININPNIKNSDLASACFYMAGGNMFIKEGTYKSVASTYPKYDVIEGFFLADGQIVLEEGDLGQDVRDGLKVNGSLLAFDDSLNRSIVLQRTLKLKDNLAFPAAAIHYDKRYLRIAPYFFGGERETFKREVGYKPL